MAENSAHQRGFSFNSSLPSHPARYAATLRLPAGTTPAPLTLTDALGHTVRCYPALAGS
jgi:hypothetical protein